MSIAELKVFVATNLYNEIFNFWRKQARKGSTRDPENHLFLIQLEDKRLIETVLIRAPQEGVGVDQSRKTVCVSIQDLLRLIFCLNRFYMTLLTGHIQYWQLKFRNGSLIS